MNPNATCWTHINLNESVVGVKLVGIATIGSCAFVIGSPIEKDRSLHRGTSTAFTYNPKVRTTYFSLEESTPAREGKKRA